VRNFDGYHPDPSHDPIAVTIQFLSLCQCLSYRRSNGEINLLGLEPMRVAGKINYFFQVCLHQFFIRRAVWEKHGGIHCFHNSVVVTIPFFSRPHCCHDSICCQGPIVVTTHCFHDPIVVPTQFLSRPHFYHNPVVVRSLSFPNTIVVTIPMLL
jgi:hypothetical protein